MRGGHWTRTSTSKEWRSPAAAAPLLRSSPSVTVTGGATIMAAGAIIEIVNEIILHYCYGFIRDYSRRRFILVAANTHVQINHDGNE